MIACTGRDHACSAPPRSALQLIQRAPLLERTRALQVFELQVNGQAGDSDRWWGKMAGRNMNGFADARARRVNTCQADRFQGVSSCLQLHCTVEVNEPNKKPPPRLRGGLCLSERLLCQAFPLPRAHGSANSHRGHPCRRGDSREEGRAGGTGTHDDIWSRADGGRRGQDKARAAAQQNFT